MKSFLAKLSAMLLLVATAVFVYSCTRAVSREVDPEFGKYIAAFTYGNVSSTSSVQIELTQDMPAVELNKEISSELFQFKPAIKGKAYWTGSRNIKFVPEPGELKVGQEYQAVFKLDKVLKVESKFKEFGFFFKVPKQSFSVEVSPFSPTKDNDVTWNSVQGTLKLVDEAPIDQVKKMFSLSGSSNPVNIKVVPTESKGTYTFSIDSLLRKADDTEYKLKISGSPIEAPKDTTVLIAIPALSTSNGFSVVDVQTSFDPQQCIRITFSDPLSKVQNIQGLVLPNGIKNYSFDIKKNVLRLFLESSSSEEKVDLQINKGLKNQDGKSLDRSYSYQLTLKKNNPEVTILNSGNILPNSSSLNIPFQAVNLWAVDVKVVKIFENNILGYLQSNDFGGDDELRRFGRLVLKKRVRLDEDPSMKLNQWNTFNLDLSKLIKQDPGAIYRIQFSIKKDYSLYPKNGVVPQIPKSASLEKLEGLTEQDEAEWDVPRTYYYDRYEYGDEEYNWDDSDNPNEASYYVGKTSSCMVFASNVGIIAKMGEDKKVHIATSNILTTDPMAGATVDVYNFQMQKIGSGKTDNGGFATVEYKGGVPFAVLVSKDKDKGFLKISSNLSLSMSNFDVSGKDIQKGLKGFVYGERGVWRPGDNIFLTFVLEDQEKILPKDHPVSIELYTPNSQLYQKQVLTSGIDGFYSFKLKTDASAPTGNWSAVVRVGGTSFHKTVKIETIKPNRLKVRLGIEDMIDVSRSSFSTTVSAQWLHGGAASNLKSNVEMSLRKVHNPFKGYEQYSFNDPTNKFTTETFTIFEGKLDGTGNATFSAKLPQATSAPGMLQANFLSRVFETGGDASFYSQSASYSPYSSYVGVKTAAEDSYYSTLETDKDNPIEIVTLTPDGKPTNRSSINVKVYHLKWSWWWSSNNEDLSSYVNSTSAKILLNETVSTQNGKARVNFRINYPDYGRYLILAKDASSGHTTGRIVYVDWPSWRGRSDKQDPNGLTMLSFSTDKKKYNAGEKATVMIPKSSNGRALISIENGTKILQKEWVATSDKEDTKYSFTVTDDMTPNFYIFATLLQPHAQTVNGLPIRMYGVQNVSVENSKTILQPTISMPDELRPEQEFTVSVSEKNKRKMTYTLAVVDEGLLDLTSFKTPNAWNDFYSRQSLGVRTWDMFDMVVGASAGKLGPLLSIGGDEEMKPGNSQFNRFKPVVEFIGPFTANAGETKSHKITLPNYVGSVRVMVVAGTSDGAYGNAEKTVAVNNPLMVLSTLPRVAGPDEDILFPVNVFVTKDNIRNVTVNIKSENGLLNPVAGTSQTVSFAGKGDTVVFFKLKAAKKLGYEKISVKATGGGEASSETIEIEIRNPNPPITLMAQGLVAASTEQSFEINMDSPQPTDWVRLEVSRMPAINLGKNFEYLMRYPHGCTEQITSKAFPALYVQTFKKFMPEEEERMKSNIEEAITIIGARQMSDGGLQYWPGNVVPNEWVTSYAGHFLLEAQKKGYNVPSSILDKWKQFQKKASQTWSKGELYKSYYRYTMDDLQQAYRLYTLALAGEPELGAMNRLKEMTTLSVQARWRLAATYAIAGKKDAATQLVAKSTDVVDPYALNNNTYGSTSRDYAMIMETYLLLGRTDKALEISQKVSAALSAEYISTQSASFGLISMSMLAEKMGSGTVLYDWELNGVKQKQVNGGAVFQEIAIKPQEKMNVKFTNKGEGQLFVRLIGYTQPLVDNTPPRNDGGLNLYVKYVDMNGRELDITKLQQGTEFFANVIVQNTAGDYLTDLTLNQIFASGWEIFNDRLFSTTGEQNTYNYRDIRDDRVYTYFNLGNGSSSSFKVRLQAAYCGRFYLPAVSTEAMYKPQLNGRTQGQWVEVVR